MIRPPFMVWIAGFGLLGAGVVTIGAAGWEAWNVGEEGTVIPWIVLALAALVEIVMALVVPVAKRWTTALGLLVALGLGVVTLALAFTVGQGLVSAATVASLGSFFAAFLCLPTLALVHAYQNELEDLF